MDPKNKTLIPLIIIFFVLGVAIGYVAHKPVTVERVVEKKTIETVTVTVTVTPSPTPTPTPTPAPTATASVTIDDFTVKTYDPSIDKPTKTIELTSSGSNPSTLSIRPEDTVLIKITGYSLQSPLNLILNSTYSKNLGTSGAVVVTFNKKGTYSLKAIIPSGDPNILPKTYAEGTITVY